MLILYTVVPLRINNATLYLGCGSVEYLLFLARIDLHLVVFEDEDQVCNHSSDWVSLTDFKLALSWSFFVRINRLTFRNEGKSVVVYVNRKSHSLLRFMLQSEPHRSETELLPQIVMSLLPLQLCCYMGKYPEYSQLVSRWVENPAAKRCIAPCLILITNILESVFEATLHTICAKTGQHKIGTKLSAVTFRL